MKAEISIESALDMEEIRLYCHWSTKITITMNHYEMALESFQEVIF